MLVFVFECLVIALGSVIVAVMCLGAISGTTFCGLENTAQQCASPAEFTVATYCLFALIGIVYADIRRRGIDSTSTSLGILLHDYAFKKNYSQRVYSGRYATLQGILAGIFVGSFGIPIVLMMVSSGSVLESFRFIQKSPLDGTLLQWWWSLLALIPLAFTLMSNNRIAAEEFISHLQLTQNSINFYRNHSDVVSIAAIEDPGLVSESGGGDADAKPEVEVQTAELKLPLPPAPSL